MERRTVLATVGVAFSNLLLGCLSTATDDEDDRTRSKTPTGNESDFEVGFAEQEGDTADSVRERIQITNISGESQYVSGYTLTYSSGYEYTLTGGLSLEAQSTVAIVSQGAGDSVALTDPPTYYRDAALPELVLEDGEETVRLLNHEDEVVIEATYTSE
ncbi:lamin tail domain-containing protein [Haloprofundus halobius]|uniref:lamin tail domain-containing protein n=1 Tax=Haloprofundus halobius TaxID=2876194 RepID=UPI001CCADFFB|nr:lamin tail domain-containing protein [Haloprofundus halobius]